MGTIKLLRKNIFLLILITTSLLFIGIQWACASKTVCKHENIVFYEEKQPDCETNGNIDYFYCPDCNEYFSSKAIGVGRHIIDAKINAESVVLLASGHDYDTGKIISLPTLNGHEGKIEYVCYNCGKNVNDYFYIDGIRASFPWYQGFFEGNSKLDNPNVIDYLNSTGELHVYYSYSITESKEGYPHGSYKIKENLQEIDIKNCYVYGSVSSAVGKYPITVQLKAIPEYSDTFYVISLNKNIVYKSIQAGQKKDYDIFERDEFTAYDGTYGKPYGVVVNNYTSTDREDCITVNEDGKSFKFVPITCPVGKGMRVITEDCRVIEYSDVTVVSRIITSPAQLQGVENRHESATGLFRYCDNVTETECVDTWGNRGFIKNYYGYFILGSNVDCSGYMYNCPSAHIGGDGAAIRLLSYGKAKGFYGVFDGRGYTISNASFHQGGFFGEVGEAKIINLGVDNAEFYPDRYPGYVTIFGITNCGTCYENCYFDVNMATTQNHQSATLARCSLNVSVKKCVFRLKMRRDDNDEMGAIVSWNMGNLLCDSVLVVFDRTDSLTPITEDDSSMSGVTVCNYAMVVANKGIDGFDYSTIVDGDYFVVSNYLPVFRTVR